MYKAIPDVARGVKLTSYVITRTLSKTEFKDHKARDQAELLMSAFC